MCGDRKSEDVFMSEETDTFNAETLCVCVRLCMKGERKNARRSLTW